ncbi:MAG TPA: SUMF1/EgtB/PvdO family nonheme iron enzyme [Anaerolineales bacterium]|nr:SUMF1/EgtB/PvdO family nonheme iron enzyme [Anaerolineales bacterium]
MKKLLPLLLLVFIISACGLEMEPPILETPTSTSIPTLSPTALPTATLEINTPTSTPVPTEEFARIRISPIDGMPQVYIPAGTFRMGGMDVRRAPDEVPDHDVTLSAYWMDQLEVTNAMYALCVQAGVCTPPQSTRSSRRDFYFGNPEFNDYPVIYVTWGQAKTYCEWAGRRLPTEAEWERAARGDDFRTFPWGEDKPDYTFANFNFIVKDTSRVGSYPLGASPFGVLDMAGNVAEWTNDFYKFDYYLISEAIDPKGPQTSSTFNRVVRGGSLGDAEINIRLAKRSSVRGSNLNAIPGSSEYLGEFSPRIGFRCAQDE